MAVNARHTASIANFTAAVPAPPRGMGAACLTLLILAVAVPTALAQTDPESPPTPGPNPRQVPRPPEIYLTDISGDSGVDFVHQNGASGTKFAVELIGPGGALLDYDGDGDLDLYLVNGGELPGMEYPEPPANALYENVGFTPNFPPFGAPATAPGTGPAFRPPFTRVPDAAGAADTLFGMGATCGDYDNDGDPDLYLANFGRNSLYRNDSGRFVDVTDSAGVGDPRWGTSSAFVDIDHDGYLDLYVCNYFQYTIADQQWYGLRKPGYRTHGGPASFKPDTDVLYRNRGDGTFEDVSKWSGIHKVPANFSLGVVAGDFDDDGDTDIYVTNDTQSNYLFLNDGQGRFVEDAVIAGAGLDQGGKPQAGMGVASGDYDGDGLIDIFCTNFSLEANTLYRGEGAGFYSDVSFQAGLGEAALPYLGFGTGFFDLENDRDLDLLVVNGHIMDNAPLYFDNLTYKEPNQIYVNNGQGRFAVADSSWGAVVKRVEASRGAMFGDLDNDGDTDLIVTDVAAPTQIIRNDGSSDNGWVRVLLRGEQSNRDGFGADVYVTAAGATRRYQVRAAYSYLTSNDPRPLAGLAGAGLVEAIEVRWPSGVVDRIENVPAGRAVLMKEGQGGVVLPEGLPSLGYAMEDEF
jgi:hypothetical protein